MFINYQVAFGGAALAVTNTNAFSEADTNSGKTYIHRQRNIIKRER
jgi:hypothetical protein